MDGPAINTEAEISPEIIAGLRNRSLVVVPRVPTHEMVEAAWAQALEEDAVGVWKEMIEAAPNLATAEISQAEV